MSFFEVIISGIVQGVTEFLPISSSGHLVILHKIIGLEEPQLALDIFLHIGTLVSIFIIFWKDIIRIVTVDRKACLFILLGTVATAAFVLLFGDMIESAFANVKAVGLMLIVTGIWLFFGGFLRFGGEGLTGAKSILIGLVQGIAAMPGISRSGVTISTALFLGLDFKKAARFSFLLSIPAIIGAFFFKVKDADAMGFSFIYLIGMIVACIVGVLSLKLLLRILNKGKFHLFGVYCIAMGVVTLLFL